VAAHGEPEVMQLEPARWTPDPIGATSADKKKTEQHTMSSMALTRAVIAARSATVGLTMCKQHLQRLQTSVQLGSLAAKQALDQCNKKMDQMKTQQEEQPQEQVDQNPELGEPESSEEESDSPPPAAEKLTITRPEKRTAEEEEELAKECTALGSEVRQDLRGTMALRKVLKPPRGLNPSDCTYLSKKLKLSTEHRCCSQLSHTGCPLAVVRGKGTAQGMRCEHYKASGPSTSCHYAKVHFEKGTQQYDGAETVANQARTNFAQCTTWEHAHNLQTIARWAHVGFDQHVSGETSEVWKKWHDDEDFVHLPDPDNITLSDRLGEPMEGTDSVQSEHEAEPITNKDKWTTKMAATSTMSVHALVSKSQECLVSKIAGKTVCSTKKTVQCAKICFLIGDVGIGSRGDLVWSQGFTAAECPTLQHIVNEARNTSTAPKSWKIPKGIAWRVPQYANLTEPSSTYGKVTLEEVVDDVPQFFTDTQKRDYLQDNYNSEDLKLKRCCFPGCEIPEQVKAGKYYGTENPWYWFDRETSMKLGVSTQFVFN